MFSRDLNILNDTDIYSHTLAILTSLSQNPKAQPAIRSLKMLSNRPVHDLDLIEAARDQLTLLRSYLVSQASPDYWYDNFVGINGEIDPSDMDSIQDLVEERHQQLHYIDICLSRMS